MQVMGTTGLDPKNFTLRMRKKSILALKNTLPDNSLATTARKRGPLKSTDERTSPAIYGKVDQKKMVGWKVETSVPNTISSTPAGENDHFLSSKFWRKTEGRYSNSRISSPGGTPLLDAVRHVADRNGRSETVNLGNQRLRLQSACGLIMNPLADIHGDSRVNSEAFYKPRFSPSPSTYTSCGISCLMCSLWGCCITGMVQFLRNLNFTRNRVKENNSFHNSSFLRGIPFLLIILNANIMRALTLVSTVMVSISLLVLADYHVSETSSDNMDPLMTGMSALQILEKIMSQLVNYRGLLWWDHTDQI
ncbi:hypothetical protein SADUNF_Sadunf12G0056100 [Salix dunnii]|uniref:Uncharacterized protein n=1 Tax=Salix dunnii TaxID=1413687 RepID=A0A835JIP2_9ROSI|nr:hypothetical protein SADUNF_Sadunf12G0056100 [Salix dunnii]